MTAPSDEKQKKTIGYGVKTPYLSFEEAIKTTKEVCRLGGFDGSIDALSKVTGNSSSSSSFGLKVKALKKFGLITTSDSSYSLTDIGKRVGQPESHQDEAQAIFEAFYKHDILAKVWESYKGKILPQAEYLANHFENNHGIPPDMKGQWAEYFVEAAKYANVLHERETGSYQVLLKPTVEKKSGAEQSTNVKTDAPAKKPETQIDSLIKTPSLPAIDVHGTEHWGILNQKRISGGRRAIIAIPDELLQEDIDTLKLILKGIAESQLDGLKKYGE